eukprot:2592144-Pyramimonas_sp.AAC.1
MRRAMMTTVTTTTTEGSTRQLEKDVAPGAALGFLGACWGLLGGPLGPLMGFWGRLGLSGRVVGFCRSFLRPSRRWGPPGALRGVSWGLLGPSRAVLGFL